MTAFARQERMQADKMHEYQQKIYITLYLK